MGQKLKETQAELDKAREHAGSLETKKAESTLHNPYLDQELRSALHSVTLCEKEEAELQDRISLIESCEEGSPISMEVYV